MGQTGQEQFFNLGTSTFHLRSFQETNLKSFSQKILKGGVWIFMVCPLDADVPKAGKIDQKQPSSLTLSS